MSTDRHPPKQQQLQQPKAQSWAFSFANDLERVQLYLKHAYIRAYGNGASCTNDCSVYFVTLLASFLYRYFVTILLPTNSHLPSPLCVCVCGCMCVGVIFVFCVCLYTHVFPSSLPQPLTQSYWSADTYMVLLCYCNICIVLIVCLRPIFKQNKK